MDVEVGMLDEVVAKVDVVDIYLVGAETVDIVAGAAGAKLLRFVAVDDEVGGGGVLSYGLKDAAENKIEGVVGRGVEVGAAVHHILIEGDAERLLGMGEELEVDELVGMASGGGVGRGEVGVFVLI